MGRQSISAVEAASAAGAGAPAVIAGQCRSGCRGNLVTITMFVHGDSVTMTSCSTCDRRTWNRGGEAVELRSLLEDIKAAQPQRINPAPVLRRAG